MITIEQVKGKTGLYFQHATATYADKKRLLQVRQTGKVKTWKTRPGEFKIPVKYGLKESFYITDKDVADWDII